MKKYITLTSLILSGTLCANAEDNNFILPPHINLEATLTPNTTPGIAVFNFGGENNESWLDQSKNWNQFIFPSSGNTPGKVTDSATQISLQITQWGMTGTGASGSFSVRGRETPAISGNLKKLSTTVFGNSTYDTLWGGSANTWGIL